MGSPTSGKTELWFEFLINMSEFYGWKHVIYTPETGTKDEIVAELASKFLQKPFYKNYPGHMSESEKYKATQWLNEYFFIIDPADKGISIVDFYDEVEKIEKDLKIKIHTTTIDPFNEIAHDMTGSNGRQDLYVENMLGLCRRNAAKYTRHNCIITHCADQQSITENGITYYPAPTARQYAGGQAWYRKGLAMLGVWRPPVGLEEKDGTPFEDNEVHVIIQKSKPKGVGNKGRAKLFFDIKKNRYYERSISGSTQYANKHEIIAPSKPSEGIKPNLDFATSLKEQEIKEEQDNLPF